MTPLQGIRKGFRNPANGKNAWRSTSVEVLRLPSASMVAAYIRIAASA